MLSFCFIRTSTNPLQWAGFFVPSTFAFFARQNDLISKGKATGCIIPLDVMGTINGCIDPLIEAPQYIEMATKNTYGFVAYNESVRAAATEALTAPGGCTDLGNQCRALAAEGDPDYNGTNETVNAICSGAFQWCFANVQGPYSLSGVRYLAPVLWEESLKELTTYLAQRLRHVSPIS